MSRPDRLCPDCDEPLVFAFRDTSGVGAHKRGDNFNTVPDTDHHLCLGCAKAWKQRLDGPLTPDIVGDLAFFTCRQVDCARPLGTRTIVAPAAGTTLSCVEGHVHVIREGDGGLMLAVEQEPG